MKKRCILFIWVVCQSFFQAKSGISRSGIEAELLWHKLHSYLFWRFLGTLLILQSPSLFHLPCSCRVGACNNSILRIFCFICKIKNIEQKLESKSCLVQISVFKKIQLQLQVVVQKLKMTSEAYNILIILFKTLGKSFKCNVIV